MSSGETGDVQYGIGAQDNYLHNAVQAEGYVPVDQYTLEDNVKIIKNKTYKHRCSRWFLKQSWAPRCYLL